MRIKELRKEKKITQIELAEIVGTSHKNISRYENLQREPDISTLIKMANYFNVTIDYLVERTSYSNNIFESLKLSQREGQFLHLFNKLNMHNQDLLFERAETLLDLQEDSHNSQNPKKGASA